MKLFEDLQMRTTMEQMNSTAVDASNCGNFAVIGFNNGILINIRIYKQG